MGGGSHTVAPLTPPPAPPDLPGVPARGRRRAPAAVRRLRPRLPPLLPPAQDDRGARGRLVLLCLRLPGGHRDPLRLTRCPPSSAPMVTPPSRSPHTGGGVPGPQLSPARQEAEAGTPPGGGLGGGGGEPPAPGTPPPPRGAAAAPPRHRGAVPGQAARSHAAEPAQRPDLLRVSAGGDTGLGMGGGHRPPGPLPSASFPPQDHPDGDGVARGRVALPGAGQPPPGARLPQDHQEPHGLRHHAHAAAAGRVSAGVPPLCVYPPRPLFLTPHP